MSEFALGGQKLGAGKGGKKKAHIFEFISNNIVPFCNAQPSTFNSICLSLLMSHLISSACSDSGIGIGGLQFSGQPVGTGINRAGKYGTSVTVVWLG